MSDLITPLSEDCTSEDLQRLAVTLNALAHPNRLRLLHLLRGGERPAGELVDAMRLVGIGQPTTSHHLKVLLDAGMVSRRREHRGSIPQSFYSLVPDGLSVVGWASPSGGDR